MEATMTSARDAAIRPSPMATQLNSTPMDYFMELISPAQAAIDLAAAKAARARLRTAAAAHDQAVATSARRSGDAMICVTAEMPSAASLGMVSAASAFVPIQFLSASTPASAALSTNLTSARHDGEPISQGLSPITITAITAVPSAASDGMVIAVSSTQQHLAQCFKFGIFVGSTAHCSLKITFRWSWSTVALPFGCKVNRPIHANRTSAIVICLNQFYFEPKFSRQLVSNSAFVHQRRHHFDMHQWQSSSQVSSYDTMHTNEFQVASH